MSGDGTFQYQWRVDGKNILGATNDSYVVAFARALNAGRYQVRVTNAKGSSVSGPATLTVLAPLPFVERRLPTNYYAGATMRVALSAKPKEIATVYAVEDQPPAGWTVGEMSEGGVV